ncbi:hypothetical protein [Ruminococcus sp. FC2018]|uniref:hypothetical protein n=1 Tax=Ruminococcus sp. FC2018 TaxID=1410617 RepID=UPI00048B03FB|nr:hypothetical protein [Ruminococcus sp. FC2018]
MDIISEIIQTDKLADAKIIKANEKKAELEQLTNDEIAGFERESSEKVETYRAKTLERCKTQTKAQIAKIEKSEKDRIAGIDELYSAKHRKWEKAIVERVFSDK